MDIYLVSYDQRAYFLKIGVEVMGRCDRIKWVVVAHSEKEACALAGMAPEKVTVTPIGTASPETSAGVLAKEKL